KDILSKYQSKNLPKLSYQELVSQKGIGKTAACRTLSAFELASRLLLSQDDEAIIIKTPDDAFQLLKEIGKHKKEHFIGLYLNARNQLIHQETISIGGLNVNIVHPREVFEPAIKHQAASVIVVHNHPSGNLEPSEEDLEITKRLVSSGKLLGVAVVDHLIIAGKKFFSLKEKGLI
ncbi:MAG: DNA repair protein RadC, partial [Patescibacteria group bacterium]